MLLGPVDAVTNGGSVPFVLALEPPELVDAHACLIEDRQERLGLENGTGVHGDRDPARPVSMMKDDMAPAAANLLPSSGAKRP